MSKRTFQSLQNIPSSGDDGMMIAGIDADTNNHFKEFEQQYLLLREKENRIYSDEELATLPRIAKKHPHYKEWVLREKTLKQLTRYFKNKKRSLEILEVGCGNGWLSNQLSLRVKCQVTGIDINGTELEQAARVFEENTECNFLYGDIQSGLLKHKKYDVIIFAASIQYFDELKTILTDAINHLNRDGEIHIADTHFYNELEVEEARQRSKSHFNSLGFPAMASMYFHHSFNDLKSFNPIVLHNPHSFSSRFFNIGSPFYWICIKKNQ